MDDATSRIESATSFREPERGIPLARPGKQRLKVKAATAQGDSPDAENLDDAEKHQLDTMA